MVEEGDDDAEEDAEEEDPRGRTTDDDDDEEEDSYLTTLAVEFLYRRARGGWAFLPRFLFLACVERPYLRLRGGRD